MNKRVVVLTVAILVVVFISVYFISFRTVACETIGCFERAAADCSRVRILTQKQL